MNKAFLLALTVATTTACSSAFDHLPGVYSIDIEQGNIIDQDMINQLRPNMTKRQVIYIMGSPMLKDMFHQNRWDYIYAKQPGGEDRTQKRLTLIFNGDVLIGVQGDLKPSALPVVRPSKESTVNLPKRHLDDTLWGHLTRWWGHEPETIKSTAPAVPDHSEKGQEILDSNEKMKEDEK